MKHVSLSFSLSFSLSLTIIYHQLIFVFQTKPLQTQVKPHSTHKATTAFTCQTSTPITKETTHYSCKTRSKFCEKCWGPEKIISHSPWFNRYFFFFLQIPFKISIYDKSNLLFMIFYSFSSFFFSSLHSPSPLSSLTLSLIYSLLSLFSLFLLPHLFPFFCLSLFSFFSSSFCSLTFSSISLSLSLSHMSPLENLFMRIIIW